MAVNALALTIRAKKLGVLIRDARLSAGKSVEDCAQALDVPPEQFEEYELGDHSPSLPELEALATYLNIPLEHFWEDQTLTQEAGQPHPDLEVVLALRQRIIGVLLRKARLEAGLSLEELAERVASSPTVIEAFELGEKPVPLPDLEALAAALDCPLKDFQDQRGPLGQRAAQQKALRQFKELPADLQAFVSKPINRPYLDLALRLSELDAHKLRAVAEGLLEITF